MRNGTANLLLAIGRKDQLLGALCILIWVVVGSSGGKTNQKTNMADGKTQTRPAVPYGCFHVQYALLRSRRTKGFVPPDVLLLLGLRLILLQSEVLTCFGSTEYRMNNPM
jgi:hypothetical protein